MKETGNNGNTENTDSRENRDSSPWQDLLRGAPEEVIRRVLKSLDILEEIQPAVTSGEYKLLRIALEWCETEKGGTPGERQKREQAGVSTSETLFRLRWKPDPADLAESEGREIRHLPRDVAEKLQEETGEDLTLMLSGNETEIIAMLIRTRDTVIRLAKIAALPPAEQKVSPKLQRDAAAILQTVPLTGYDSMRRLILGMNECRLRALSEEEWEKWMVPVTSVTEGLLDRAEN